MVEVDQGSFSIEPMLWIKDRLYTWADVELAAGTARGLDAGAVRDLGDGRVASARTSRGDAERRVACALSVRESRGSTTVRPACSCCCGRFKSRRRGRVSAIWAASARSGTSAWRDGAVRVNETTLIVPAIGAGTVRPLGFGALRFDDGFMADYLTSGALPAAVQVHDSFGFATGALGFELSSEGHQTAEVVLNCMPLAAAPAAAEPAFDWSTTLAVTQWAGNGWMTDAVRAALTATAHVLVTRSGPALQPGPRRYTRSWIRDGAMMSAALLRMGHAAEVREFIRWYAPHQRADGFVPCCVDSEGTDWLVEHDSHGELLALIADYHRFTADDAFIGESWPYIDKAAGCIERLLGEDGLLPISVSHEGYLAQPVHSYWDDFWALRGLRDAADLAGKMGREACSATLGGAWRRGSRLRCSRRSRQPGRSASCDFIPGSIEWADFDPTATANAIYLLDVPEALDRDGRRAHLRQVSGRLARQAQWRRSMDRTTRHMRFASSARWCAWEGATRRWSCCASFCRIAARGPGTSGRRSRGGTTRRPPTSAICRTPGLPPNTCSPCAASSPTSAKPIASLILAAGLAPEWIEGSGVEVSADADALRPVELFAAQDGCRNLAIRDRRRNRRQDDSASAAAARAAQRDGRWQRRARVSTRIP